MVKSATVHKLYPDTLAVTVEERRPFALWQNDGHVSIVSRDGTAIDEMHDQRFARLPFVVGAGANERAPEIVALLDAVPDIKARVRAAVLVAQRRWNLSLDNGVLVRLPEEGRRQGARLSFDPGRQPQGDGEGHLGDRSALAGPGRLPPRRRRRCGPRGDPRQDEEEGWPGMSQHPFDRGLTPKLKPLAPKRSAVLSVLDVGTNKVVCLIAKLRPLEGADLLPGRAIRPRSSALAISAPAGIKAGAIVDMELAELSIRQAVDAAERMAGVQGRNRSSSTSRAAAWPASIIRRPSRSPATRSRTATSTAFSMRVPAIR